MKGNYQYQQSMLKLSPEAAGVSSKIYQIQRYTKLLIDKSINFTFSPRALIPAK